MDGFLTELLFNTTRRAPRAPPPLSLPTQLSCRNFLFSLTP